MLTPAVDTRKWHRKKRNVFRVGVVLLCLVCVLFVFMNYTSLERRILLIGIFSSTAGVIFYTYFLSYFFRTRLKNRVRYKFGYLFVAILYLGLLYLIFMFGCFVTDIVKGPVTKEVVITERWDPRRGGDQVRTSDGHTYEMAEGYVDLQEGRRYKVKIFRASRFIIGIEQIR
ncbi:hypothetical protein SAMN05421868_11858 [Paenibacillus naphthalenovorans]|nr:hypothetical protein SAMN05421868_11858 [Paenibacillus naphthalenovorans]